MAEYPDESVLQEIIPSLETAILVEHGGQKAVYKALLNGEYVALKMIAVNVQEEAADDMEEESTAVDEIAARAAREVGILKDVDVPVLARLGSLDLNSVRIGEQPWIYFTEEWIEGNSLRDMLRQETLSLTQLARLGQDLIEAACWLARRNFVHRDIKPANIMWSENRLRFVLLDPGIALDLEGPSLTRSPMVVGTAAYLSPEQMDPTRKRNLDFRSDLFAIGIVLYEAAVGEHPFRPPGTSQKDVWGKILTSTPHAVSARVDEFPVPLSDFISRLLGKKPHMRFRTCDRALADLQCIANSFEDSK